MRPRCKDQEREEALPRAPGSTVKRGQAFKRRTSSPRRRRKNKRHLRRRHCCTDQHGPHGPDAVRQSLSQGKGEKCLAANVVSPHALVTRRCWPGKGFAAVECPGIARKRSCGPGNTPTVTAATRSACSGQLWIARINAASRGGLGLTYSKFMAGRKKAKHRHRPPGPCRHGRERSCHWQHRREGELA